MFNHIFNLTFTLASLTLLSYAATLEYTYPTASLTFSLTALTVLFACLWDLVGKLSTFLEL